MAVDKIRGGAGQEHCGADQIFPTAKLVANLLTAAGANRVLTVDLHAQQIQGFFDIPVDHLYASPVFYSYIRNKPWIREATVFSPDVGGLKYAAAVADMLGLPYGFVAKRRTSATTVQATSLVGEVEGRDIILVDDMTETAGTLTAAAELLKKNGARSVRAVVSHCMIQEIAYDRLRAGHIDEVITTNSVPLETRGLPITVLSIAPLLADAIRRIHGNSSVTDLFPIKGH